MGVSLTGVFLSLKAVHISLGEEKNTTAVDIQLYQMLEPFFLHNLFLTHALVI